MVYIVQAKTTNLVKIGCCLNLKGRMDKMHTDCPFHVELLVVLYTGNFELENSLHTRFAEYRSKGEWFRLEGRLKLFVDNNRIKDKKILDFVLDKPIPVKVMSTRKDRNYAVGQPCLRRIKFEDIEREALEA